MPLSRSFFKDSELNYVTTAKVIDTIHVPKLREEPLGEQAKQVVTSDKAETSETPQKRARQLERQFKELKAKRKQDLVEYEEERRKQLQRELENEKMTYLRELKELKGRVLEDAQVEVANQHQIGYKTGFTEGQIAGQTDGYQEGYQEGQVIATELRAESLQLLKDAQQAVKTYQLEKQSELLGLAKEMAEKIIQSQIEQTEEQLFGLLKPILNKINKVDNFITILTQECYFDVIQTKMTELKLEQPLMKYTVLIDPTLNKVAFTVETDYEVIKFDLEQQLSAMVQLFEEVKTNEL